MWKITFDAKAEKELGRLSGINRQRILRFLHERIGPSENPRLFGEALAGSLAGYWKYRVGDCRVIAKINDKAITVYIVRVGNRREIYR